MKIELLLKEVEHLRTLMYEIALHKGISHPEVLLISQQLDKRLNEYDAVIYRNCEHLQKSNHLRKTLQ